MGSKWYNKLFKKILSIAVHNTVVNRGQQELAGLCLGRGVASGTMTTAAGYSLEVVDPNI